MIWMSGFRTGNDYGDVWLMIHWKIGYEMREVIQAQGCGGRDG